MSDKINQAADDLRKILNESQDKAAVLNAIEQRSVDKKNLAKEEIKKLAEKLNTVFSEKGKHLEVITPTKNADLIEILFYPETVSKEVRGVNTAALRIEFWPKNGSAKVLKRESFFMPFEVVNTVKLDDEKSVEQLSDAAIDFAKSLASK